MSRKLIWFWNTLFLFIFAVTLVAINPALAGAPVGFFVAFSVALLGAFLVDYLIVARVMPKGHKWASGFCFAFWFFTFFGLLGTPTMALIAMALVILDFCLVRKQSVIDAELAQSVNRMSLKIPEGMAYTLVAYEGGSYGGPTYTEKVIAPDKAAGYVH